jgi:hypothetical protein
VVKELLYFSKRNVFWQPYSESVYKGMKGTIECFYGRGLLIRLRGMLRFTVLSLRMFFK